MTKSTFVYVTYIRTTPEKLWHALTDREFSRRYWLGASCDSDFKTGSPWRLVFDDGRVADSGEILESEPHKRLVIKWFNQWSPELNAEGEARCVMELEQAGEAVKLTIIHSMERAESKLIEKVGGGWPKIISNLKSLLETGSVVLPDK